MSDRWRQWAKPISENKVHTVQLQGHPGAFLTEYQLASLLKAPQLTSDTAGLHTQCPEPASTQQLQQSLLPAGQQVQQCVAASWQQRPLQ